MKIIGIGLNKTGTTTLGRCMRYWGLKHIGNDKAAIELFLNDRIDQLIDMLADYDSCEDWPWAPIYGRLDERYPNSKFILTKRKSPETWFKSLCSHAERTGPSRQRERIYGYAMPSEHKDEHIDFYNRHNAQVEQYFRDRPDDLLVVCWETGDGWQELGRFLGREAPPGPLPHANKRRSPFMHAAKRGVRQALGRQTYRNLSAISESIANAGLKLSSLSPLRSSKKDD